MVRFANNDNLPQILEPLARRNLQEWKQELADHCDLGLRIIEKKFVLMGFQERIQRHRDRANPYCAEEAVQKLRRVRQQERYTLSRLHAQSAKEIADAVYPV